MTDTSAPARVSFTRAGWAALTLVAVLLIALLGTQLALIEDQRSTTDRQLAATARQADAAVPLIEKATPLVEQSVKQLPQTREVARRTISLARTTEPLVEELTAARAPEQLQAAGALARRLLAADLPGATRTLMRADLPKATARLARLTSDVSRLTSVILEQDRLQRLLVRSTSVLGEIRRRDLIAKSATAAETVPDIERLLQASHAILRQSLVVQSETRSLTAETLATTRETRDLTRETRDLTREARDEAERAADAAESIDRKTGPSLRPTSGG